MPKNIKLSCFSINIRKERLETMEINETHRPVPSNTENSGYLNTVQEK